MSLLAHLNKRFFQLSMLLVNAGSHINRKDFKIYTTSIKKMAQKYQDFLVISLEVRNLEQTKKYSFFVLKNMMYHLTSLIKLMLMAIRQNLFMIFLKKNALEYQEQKILNGIFLNFLLIKMVKLLIATGHQQDQKILNQISLLY